MERIYSPPGSRGGHFSSVKDLERSQQWTSLAADINDLERAKMRENVTSSTRNRMLHRRSMPEPQQTSLIFVDVDTDDYGSGSLGKKSTMEHYFLPIGSGSIDESVDSWSWGPERERSPDKKYFGNNNYQNYDYNRPDWSVNNNNQPIADQENNNRRNTYHENSQRRLGEDRIDGVISQEDCIEKNSITKGMPNWNDGRFDTEETTAYRGSREKLHEIFRRNRDLRREFFATVPKSASESFKNRTNAFSEFKDRSDNRDEVRQETGSGYGSVETLTSQSNNSEISGIQNRRTENSSRASNNSRASEVPENGTRIPREIILESNQNLKKLTMVSRTANFSEFGAPTRDNRGNHQLSSSRNVENVSVLMSPSFELSSPSGDPTSSLESSGFYGRDSPAPPPLPSSDPPSSLHTHQLLISGDSLSGTRPSSITANPPDPPERRGFGKEKYGAPGPPGKENVPSPPSPQGYQVESEGLRMLNRFEARIENRKLSPLFLLASDKLGNRNSPGDSAGLSRKNYKSMPDLAQVGVTGSPRLGVISRIAVNGSTIDLNLADQICSREKFGNRDEGELPKAENTAFRKLEVTQVRPKLNYVEEPQEIHATRVDLWENSKLRNRRRHVPAPLDLSRVTEALREESLRYDRKILRDYSVESTPLQGELVKCKVTVLDGSTRHGSSERPRVNAALKTATNLLNLSRPVVPNRGVSSSETKPLHRGEKTRKNQSPSGSARFRSSVVVWCDGNFEDRKNPVVKKHPEQILTRKSSLDHRKSTGSLVPATGNVFPSVYAPIPYKSPRRYVEGEVTIHYRSPVRTEAKEVLSEAELARRSAENMRRVYQEERRRKYLQELHDIDSRRHTDNFTPSQKSPIPLNRYDDFVDDLSYRSRSQEQTPEPRLVAKALYNFVGQSSRELTFRRGDIIFVRRQVDKNWYEGEHNAMIGLFPFNYVEILPYDGIRTTMTPKKPYEGQARAKFNFVAQTTHELSLVKGDLVVLTRRVDENWYEGRIGNRKGIFPISYVEVLVEPGIRPETPAQNKPVAAPAAHSLLSNGSAGGKLSMGPHHYTPSIPTNTNASQPNYNSLPRMGGTKLHVAPVNETLHIDTHSEPLRYRSLYNYRPQNDDELELKEGDTVYVMEKCDDGWFVGSSQRTGCFGTFPGNYVERL